MSVNVNLTITSAFDTVTVYADETSDLTGGYAVERWDPGVVPIVNDLATSKQIDGADVSNSVRGVGAVQVTVRCVGASHNPDDALAKAVLLAQVVEVEGDDGYAGEPELLITEQLTDAAFCSHHCYRTAADIIRDPVALDHGIVRVQFSAQCVRQVWTL